jgi:hypothetical protein
MPSRSNTHLIPAFLKSSCCCCKYSGSSDKFFIKEVYFDHGLTRKAKNKQMNSWDFEKIKKPPGRIKHPKRLQYGHLLVTLCHGFFHEG